MDIFKALSRATKLQKYGTKPNSERLPSDGQTANPQLFGQREAKESLSNGSTSLGKRKRGEGPSTQGLDGSNSFAKNALVRETKRNGVLADNLLEEPEFDGFGDEEDSAQASNAKVEIGLEERKRILRLHKVKINLLARNAERLEQGGPPKSKASSHGKKEREKPSIYPAPLQSFLELRSRFALDQRLAKNIQQQGYTTPTEVQLAALPSLLGDVPLDADGQEMRLKGMTNLLTVAPTGSGKTLAFLIPIIHNLLQKAAIKKDTSYQGPSSVILVPTKELANQIVNEGKKLASGTGLRIALMRKDMAFVTTDANSHENRADECSEESDEEKDVRTPAEGRTKLTVPKSDILVSTPLTLLHALEGRGKARTTQTVRHLVLDEADVLLDPLFQEQTMNIWRLCTNIELSVSMWSATMASSIEALALEEIKSREVDSPVLRLVVGIKDTALPTIRHDLIYAATEAGKLLAMRQLLHPTSTSMEGGKAVRPPFLVFTQTIPRAIALQSELKYDIPPEAGGSNRIAVLHSGLSDTARSRVMAGFRRGEIWIIITTDLLARGVDFRGLNGVVNFDVPTSAAAYIHRAGRTGRAGREGGVAVTFYTKEDIPHVKAVANVIAASEKLRNEDEGTSSIQQWLVDALPTPTKQEKQQLKRKGVESRRIGVKGERISTKSGYDRRRESMLKASRSRASKQVEEDVEATDFEGFD